MEAFDPYSHAIASLALWGLIMIALSMVSTGGKVPKDRAESGLPKRDYSNEAYRRHRAFQNYIAGVVEEPVAEHIIDMTGM